MVFISLLLIFIVADVFVYFSKDQKMTRIINSLKVIFPFCCLLFASNEQYSLLGLDIVVNVENFIFLGVLNYIISFVVDRDRIIDNIFHSNLLWLSFIVHHEIFWLSCFSLSCFIYAKRLSIKPYVKLVSSSVVISVYVLYLFLLDIELYQTSLKDNYSVWLEIVLVLTAYLLATMESDQKRSVAKITLQATLLSIFYYSSDLLSTNSTLLFSLALLVLTAMEYFSGRESVNRLSIFSFFTAMIFLSLSLPSYAVGSFLLLHTLSLVLENDLKIIGVIRSHIKMNNPKILEDILSYLVALCPLPFIIVILEELISKDKVVGTILFIFSLMIGGFAYCEKTITKFNDGAEVTDEEGPDYVMAFTSTAISVFMFIVFLELKDVFQSHSIIHTVFSPVIEKTQIDDIGWSGLVRGLALITFLWLASYFFPSKALERYRSESWKHKSKIGEWGVSNLDKKIENFVVWFVTGTSLLITGSFKLLLGGFKQTIKPVSNSFHFVNSDFVSLLHKYTLEIFIVIFAIATSLFINQLGVM
jgi:hypothetical protein